MGMSAGQARLLQLTTRFNDIGYELQNLSNQKVSLSREMQSVSREYQNSLSQKILKWSNNSGVSYMDLSYANLMRPSAMNKNKAYLLTDASDRVVVDNTYKKYAEMISANGAAGGDWESNRSTIISELTGIPAENIDNASSYQEAIWDSDSTLHELAAEEPSKSKFTENNINDLLKKAGTATGCSNAFSKGSNWEEAYGNTASTIPLGASTSATANLNGVLNHLNQTLSKYFLDDADKFTKAIEEVRTDYTGLIANNADQSNSASALRGNSSNYNLNVTTLINEIMGHYANLGGEYTEAEYNNQNQYLWYDIDSSSYSEWKKEHDEWQKKYDEASNTYNSSVGSNNQLFTAEEEALINFYDELFSAIAEKGWSFNNQVNDVDYLNQMLQNNLYMMTTVDRDTEYDANSGEYVWDNDYETDIASNFTNIFTVSDSDAREDALVEYEHKKAIINEKESRIDTRMKNLETEQAAINQMLQGLEQVENDNIDRTMSWSA